MTARFRVHHAGPHVSFQDRGRPGHMRFGVPRSGPVDRVAHATSNVVLGNDPAATTIEVSVGGLVLDCVDGAITVAVTGGSFSTSWMVTTVRSGDRLSVTAGPRGSWAYIAVAGHLDVPEWLGHTATHATSGFGGGVLRTGDDITVAAQRVSNDRVGEIPQPAFAAATGRARVVLGPQDHHFGPESVVAFTNTTYTMTTAYDRMGVRLQGAALTMRAALAIPSEPIVRGSVQVGGDDVPTVLLADHQTTGGYPKIATVISADMDGLVQLRPGDSIDFEAVTPDQAVAAARERAVLEAVYLGAMSRPARTLSQRLMQENLISSGDSDSSAGDPSVHGT